MQQHHSLQGTQCFHLTTKASPQSRDPLSFSSQGETWFLQVGVLAPCTGLAATSGDQEPLR